jgi:hypothetical protein
MANNELTIAQQAAPGLPKLAPPGISTAPIGTQAKPQAIQLTETQKGTTFLDGSFGAGSTEAVFVFVVSMIVLVIWSNIAMFFMSVLTNATGARETYQKEVERNIKAVTAHARATAQLDYLFEQLKEKTGWTLPPSQTFWPFSASTSKSDPLPKPPRAASSMEASSPPSSSPGDTSFLDQPALGPTIAKLSSWTGSLPSLSALTRKPTD